MNTLVKAIVLSLSTALIAAPVMAAPQDHQPKKTQVQQHKAPTHQHKQQADKKVLKPSKDWKIGHKVPSQYQTSSYKFNQNQNKHLSKAGKNQHWIKVNGDYILINDKTHNIIKIVRG